MGLLFNHRWNLNWTLVGLVLCGIYKLFACGYLPTRQCLGRVLSILNPPPVHDRSLSSLVSSCLLCPWRHSAAPKSLQEGFFMTAWRGAEHQRQGNHSGREESVLVTLFSGRFCDPCSETTLKKRE